MSTRLPPALVLGLLQAGVQPVIKREAIGRNCPSLAAALFLLREQTRLSQWDLAKLVNTTQTTMSNLERSRPCKLDRGTVERLTAVASRAGLASLAKVINDKGAILELEYRRGRDR